MRASLMIEAGARDLRGILDTSYAFQWLLLHSVSIIFVHDLLREINQFIVLVVFLIIVDEYLGVVDLQLD